MQCSTVSVVDSWTKISLQNQSAPPTGIATAAMDVTTSDEENMGERKAGMKSDAKPVSSTTLLMTQTPCAEQNCHMSKATLCVDSK